MSDLHRYNLLDLTSDTIFQSFGRWSGSQLILHWLNANYNVQEILILTAPRGEVRASFDYHFHEIRIYFAPADLHEQWLQRVTAQPHKIHISLILYPSLAQPDIQSQSNLNFISVLEIATQDVIGFRKGTDSRSQLHLLSLHRSTVLGPAGKCGTAGI